MEFLTAQVQQCQIQLQNGMYVSTLTVHVFDLMYFILENQMCRALEEENVELKVRIYRMLC